MPQASVDLHVLRDALLDRSLSQVGDALLHATVSTRVTWAGVPVTPAAELSVRVFNRPEDRDEDGVLSSATATHIAFDRQSAWIKYKTNARLTVSPKLPAAAMKAGADVGLSDYRVHRATDRAFAAMVGDLDSPRCLLSLEDVRKLAPGEALAMELEGSLSASLTASWSDILGSSLRTLFASIADRATPLVVKLDSGLSAGATVRITDQFSVVISRTAEQHYRIAVKKARSRNHTFGIELEAGVEISGVPAVEQALKPAFAALTEAADGRKEILRQIEGLRKSLRSRLESLLRWKLTAGFAYEYARIDESKAIADYVLLDSTALADDYARVLRGDWAEIAQSLRGNRDARSLVQYLNERTLTRRSSAGLAIGLGRWVALEAREHSVFTQSVRTSLDGFQLITSKGTRRYSEKNIPLNDFEWLVDLDASMTEFLEHPATTDLVYGLQYVMLLERGAISEHDVERMLDLALMWNVCVPEPGMFREALGRRGTLRVQLAFDSAGLLATLGAFAEASQWAEPLAAAMPYVRQFHERRRFAARAAVYEEPWRAWIEGAQISRHEWAARLRRHVHGGLRMFEERALPGSFAWTVGEGHPRLRGDLDAFVRGARMLHDAMTAPRDVSVIGEAYAFLSRAWSQRLTLAASGRYLLARATDAGITPNVTLQVEFADQSITV